MIAGKILLQLPESLSQLQKLLPVRYITDYELLAGVGVGIILITPVIVVGIYFIYLKISKHVRGIVNEYGRG